MMITTTINSCLLEEDANFSTLGFGKKRPVGYVHSPRIQQLRGYSIAHCSFNSNLRTTKISKIPGIQTNIPAGSQVVQDWILQ